MRGSRRHKLRVLAGAALLLLSACGSSFDGRVYRKGELAFRVGPIPPSWRRIEVDQTLIAFRDDTNEATMAVNGRCGVDGDDVPLSALTQHLFLQFTDRELRSQELLDLDGREALRSELVGKLDGVPKHYVVYVLKKDGCVYDFVRVANDGGGRAEFDRFVLGFSTEVAGES
jgi:hypothetical protein